MSEFITIPNFPNYAINRQGQVRNSRTGQILKHQQNSTGGTMVKIPDAKGVESTLMIARTVYQTFRGQLSRYQFIQFLDKDQSNCSLDNLTIKTMPEIRRKNETPT